MKINLNGNKTTLKEEIISLDDLINDFSLDRKKIAIEINKEIIFPKEYSSTMISENDNIEIIYFVGGG